VNISTKLSNTMVCPCLNYMVSDPLDPYFTLIFIKNTYPLERICFPYSNYFINCYFSWGSRPTWPLRK